MSDIVSRWVVVQQHEVTPADVDGNGSIREDVVEQWMRDVCDAYLEQCERLEAVVVRARLTAPIDAAALGAATSVRVSAGAKEVWPDAFSLGTRIRPRGDDSGSPIDATWIMSIETPTGDALPVTDEIRDELIALEHAARHTN